MISASTDSRRNISPLLLSMVKSVLLYICTLLGSWSSPLAGARVLHLFFLYFLLLHLLANLHFGISVCLIEVFCDMIALTKEPDSKFISLSIAWHCLCIHVHELLLNSQVVVRDCQNSNPVLEILWILHVSLHSSKFAFLAFLLFFFILLFILRQSCRRGQVVHQKRRLNDYDCLMSMGHSVIMAAELWQNGTHV